MKLNEIMEQVKLKFHIDEKLQVHIYKDTIEFIEFTSGITNDSGIQLMSDFYGKLFIMYYENKRITAIEPQCLGLMTPRNIQIYNFLCDLINQTINDLDTYITTNKNTSNIKELAIVIR